MSDETPFNTKDVLYTPLSPLLASSFNPTWRSRRRLKFSEAIAFNKAMASILDSIDLDDLADRVRECRPGPEYFRCGKWRYCAFCGPLREERLVRAYRQRLLRPGVLSHLTLTTRARNVLTRDVLGWLVGRFGLFRQQDKFCRAVAGGVVNFQIDHGDCGWLLHLHAVLHRQDDLSTSWIKKTWTGLGGGWYPPKNPIIMPGTAHQVLAYGARRPDLPLDAKLIREFYFATFNFRHIQPWGTFFPTYGKRVKRRAQSQALVAAGGPL